jgi:hypothetical protein
MNNLYAIVAGVMIVVAVAVAVAVFAVAAVVFVNDPLLVVVVVVFIVFVGFFILNITSYTVHAPSSGKKME